MITLGKEGGLSNYRQACAFITREDIAKRTFDEIAPKYKERTGGYTRITRIGARKRRRRGDGGHRAGVIPFKTQKTAQPF